MLTGNVCITRCPKLDEIWSDKKKGCHKNKCPPGFKLSDGACIA
jgi:hypothetical protein